MNWDACFNELRELQGRIDRLTTALLASAPPEAMPLRPTAKRAAEAVLPLVAARMRILSSDILGRSRHGRIALARQICMALVRELSADPFTEVGRVFDRDHGTVMYAVEAITERCQVEADTAMLVSELRTNLRALFALEQKREAA